MSRTLVVCFSRTGHTRAIAARLAGALSADLDLITESGKSRLGLMGWLRSGYEGTFQRPAAIDPVKHQPSAYELVVIGTPIWSTSLSSPVRAYLEQHRGQFASVAFFCTCGGRGAARVFSQMTQVVGKLPLGTLMIRETELHAPDLGGRLEAFAARVKGASVRAAGLAAWSHASPASLHGVTGRREVRH